MHLFQTRNSVKTAKFYSHLDVADLRGLRALAGGLAGDGEEGGHSQRHSATVFTVGDLGLVKESYISCTISSDNKIFNLKLLL